MPPMKQFGPAHVGPPTRSNREIAQDFLDLSFQMESGEILPFMTRFDGPITVRTNGTPPSTLSYDLNALLSRLRNEAGIDIRRATAAKSANISINMVPSGQFKRLRPTAACFVVPGVSNWNDYRRYRHDSITNWKTLRKRTQMAIFIPDNVSPQEMRDCLHEELAQALGPLNDLFRLPDSIFNDDNYHSILTGFDMLVLRAYYAPDLHNGTTRQQAAAALPRILASMNPAGQFASGRAPVSVTPKSWESAIRQTINPAKSHSARRAAAMRAVTIARNHGWADVRTEFSLHKLGRLTLAQDAGLARSAFHEALSIFRGRPEMCLQAAQITMQLAAISLSDGGAQIAINQANSSLPALLQAQDAVTLSMVLMIKAEALDLLNHTAEAREVRLDSLGWARYAFGSKKAALDRLAGIAALTPK
ncbi:DUF2927 domain-containing protein [Profundibacter sp.]|uniref:DUF2927 domain-containing protein n=1 Tax=Profundibacter sp. TaxID=3101071 RepID=UPI003D0E5520